MKVKIQENKDKVFNLSLDEIKKQDGVYYCEWNGPVNTHAKGSYVLVLGNKAYNVDENTKFNPSHEFNNNMYVFCRIPNATVTLEFN